MYINDITRKKSILSHLVFYLILVLVCVGIFFGTIRFVNFYNTQKGVSTSVLHELWELGDYQSLFDQTGKILEKKPIHSAALFYRGFAAFYLAASHLDIAVAQSLIDEAINCFRISMKYSKWSAKNQIAYMLGKSYYQKNVFSSYHYYADVAVKYLTIAKNGGYFANDISEYLGLCYASMNMVDESIDAFIDALFLKESETLLFAIAEQYHKQKNYQMARQYLNKIVSSTIDDMLALKSRNKLGQIYIDEENYSGAVAEFNTILEKDPNFADAYYGLGLVYKKQGDNIKARAEFRKTLKIKIDHAGAQEALS
ncbi:MAG: tetratricopeptide repeat protein [Treponemataceae bacterium]